jgi:uncharacterized lipoprotein YmbA
MKRMKSWLGAALLLPLAVAGCAGSPPQSFYTLGAKTAPAPRQSAATYSIAIDPASVPAIVDRPQIVLDTGPNQIALAEQSRWAEPLKESIPRVMADDLAQLLPEAEVFANPHGTVSDPDYRVRLDVQRFASSQGEAATVDILWSVSIRQDGTQEIGRSFKREPAQGGGFAALAAAHERALAAVSRDIAAAVKKNLKPRPDSGAAPGIQIMPIKRR